MIVVDLEEGKWLYSRLSLNLDIGLIDDPQLILDELPVGWRNQPWVHIMNTFRMRFPDFAVTHMRIDKGLLRFDGEGHPDHYFIFDSLVQGIARASALVCLRCGNAGMRRKDHFGMPGLCNMDFIWYLNSLDKLGLL